MKKAIMTFVLAGTLMFFGHQTNAQTTALTVTLTKMTDAYDQPNGTVVTRFGPQTINVIATSENWEEISSSIGPLWLDTTKLNEITLNQLTDAYDSPNGNKVTRFGPQTIPVIASSGDWVKFNTSLGPLWIDTSKLNKITLNQLTDAYDSPNGKKVTRFGAQTISVIASSGNWVEFNTSLGPLWLDTSNLNTITLNQLTDAYDSPNGNKVTRFGPQTIPVIASSGDWVKFNSGLGPLWLDTSKLNTITLNQLTDAYDSPNGKGVTRFGAQTIPVIASSGDWVKFNSGLGPLWIDTTRLNKFTITQLTDAYDSPNGKRVTSFSPQMVTVITSSGSWVEFNTGLGPLWLNTAKFNTLTLTKLTDAYDGPYGNKVTSFSPQTVTVLSVEGQWYQIATGLGPLFVNPSLSPANGKTIVIDPGHGGWDSGAIAIDGTLERDYNYSFAAAIKSSLQARGYNAILTRPSDNSCVPGTTDTHVDLQCRVDVATNNHADLFISVHSNTLPGNSSVYGTEIYYNASNDYDGNENPYPVQSKLLANDLDAVVPPAAGTTNRGVFESDYYVNRMATVPSVLMELGYLSNWGDLNLLKSAMVLSRVGEAVANGVDTYFQSLVN